jgi:RimJ/RimL family protein N-acetyltransferase
MWPVAGLRLRTGDVSLRPVVEPDLDLLGALLPADLALDPRIATPFGLPLREERAVVTRQEYWRNLGAWTPDAWVLPFLVETGAEVVGVQTLEGTCSDGELTIETASWLVADRRGRGIGTTMRHAVLGFGFDVLGAVAAVSEAWAINHGSLGVSRALGYEEVRTQVETRGDGTGLMTSVRLSAAGWAGRPRPAVAVDGWEPARPFFTPAR